VFYGSERFRGSLFVHISNRPQSVREYPWPIAWYCLATKSLHLWKSKLLNVWTNDRITLNAFQPEKPLLKMNTPSGKSDRKRYWTSSSKRPMQIRAIDHPSGSQNFPRPPDCECKSSYKWFLPRTCSNCPSETVEGSRQQLRGFIRCNNRRSAKGNVECLDQAAWLLIPK